MTVEATYMVIKVGSIVKITYRGSWESVGWQTGIIGDPRGSPWMPITYLTPPLYNNFFDAGLEVGSTERWYITNCLAFFDLEVLEEGAGKELVLWARGGTP